MFVGAGVATVGLAVLPSGINSKTVFKKRLTQFAGHLTGHCKHLIVFRVPKGPFTIEIVHVSPVVDDVARF